MYGSIKLTSQEKCCVNLGNAFMLHEKGITFIVTPLKSLGSQLSNESIKKGFPSVSITAELLGEKLGLVKVRQSTKVFSQCSYGLT